MTNPKFHEGYALLFFLSLMFVPQILAQTINNTSPDKSSPTIQVENRRYQVNETAVFHGKGFEQYEQITIYVKEINDSLEKNNLLSSWIVFSNNFGKNTFNWTIPTSGNFEIIAVGNKTHLPTRTTISSLVPTPIVISGNPGCSDLNASTNPAFAHITSDFGFKLDNNSPTGTFPFANSPGFPTVLTGGAPTVVGHSVTAVSTGGSDLAWTSTLQITAVIMKGGPLGANAYPYNPASMGDPGPLQQPSGTGISHVEFCFEMAPTAAEFTIGGRVLSPFGRGLARAIVSISDTNGNTRNARANQFGFYHFKDIDAGQTYIFNVRHRAYIFETRVLTITDSLDDLNFSPINSSKTTLFKQE